MRQSTLKLIDYPIGSSLEFKYLTIVYYSNIPNNFPSEWFYNFNYRRKQTFYLPALGSMLQLLAHKANVHVDTKSAIYHYYFQFSDCHSMLFGVD